MVSLGLMWNISEVVETTMRTSCSDHSAPLIRLQDRASRVWQATVSSPPETHRVQGLFGELIALQPGNALESNSFLDTGSTNKVFASFPESCLFRHSSDRGPEFASAYRKIGAILLFPEPSSSAPDPISLQGI